MKIKDLVKRLIGQGNTGRLEFFLSPGQKDGFGGPFNGQRFRQRIFFDLLYSFPIRALVETGMFRGTTTALFGATTLPVFSSENNPRYFSFSRLRFLLAASNIHAFNSDSRAFLRELGEDASVPKDNVFFYLDAHWEDDLPLREELEIIFSKWNSPIVMIDDFDVPGSGYGFDDYGVEKTLNLGYIEPVVSANGIAMFFPAVKASDETGARRGCVVLCREAQSADVAAKVGTLVRHEFHARR